MKKNLFFFMLISCSLFFFSCTSRHGEITLKPIKSVEINHIYQCNCSIRALYADSSLVIFSGSNGKYGYINPQTHTVDIDSISSSKGKLDFRGIAHTTEKDYILSAGNPAVLYNISPDKKPELIYRDTTSGIFLDALTFLDNQEGIIIGDPLPDKNKLTFLMTHNGGEIWKPITHLPKSQPGEAAFAASNSNIAVYKNNIWVITGGAASRVFHSPDRGKSWEVFPTPLVSGETSGGYSIDFYNDKKGIIFGGDFKHPERNKANKALTTDGGKNWELLSDGENPGYKSKVAFIPETGGKELIAIGFTGISYSSNSGETWKKLSNKGYYTFSFLNDSTAYAAGDGGIALLNFRR